MPFDPEKLRSADTQFVEEDVPVPELKPFFDEGDLLIWKVRNLTAIELGQIESEAASAANVAKIIEGLISKVPTEQTNALKEQLGLSDEAPIEYRKGVAQIIKATIGIKVDKPLIVKMADFNPNCFYRIVAAIRRLSGQGKTLGKQNGSGD